MSDAQQERVFAFLGDPATHGGAKTRRIDTHAAAVFLAGPRVFKVKRAVRFPFLDYSTLALREAACRAELGVNRAFAPELYLRVVPVTEAAGGGLEIGGEGKVVEWAVEMRRFDEQATLDHLADAGRLDLALADRLAVAVARAHAAAEPVSPNRWLASLADILAQNREELCGHPRLFPRPAVDAMAASARHALGRLLPLLERRAATGAVRRCHGDLHLGNIALIDDHPVLFDAIEFSTDLATIDVFYDLAFLVMDMTERRLDAAANVVLNRYLAESAGEDDDIYAALAALPLFMSARAAIRAKVTAARLADAPEADMPRLAAAALDYFDLAVRLLGPPAPTLTAVGGLSGTGKSVLARRLAPYIGATPGAVLLRSDVERKRLFGVPETQRLPDEAYRAEVTQEVYASLARKAAAVLAAGHAVVVDAVFARPDEREAIAAVAAAAGVGFQGLFLELGLAARSERLAARRGDASDATVEVARHQESYELGRLDWRIVDASGPPDDTLARAVTGLSGMRFADDGEDEGVQ